MHDTWKYFNDFMTLIETLKDIPSSIPAETTQESRIIKDFERFVEICFSSR